MSDDLAAIKNKYKQVRRENTQLRSLLKQNEAIIQKNIEQLKDEKNLSLRLCQALLPIVKKFIKSEVNNEGQMIYAFPKTAEDLIELIEKVQKNKNSEDFFKQTTSNPSESENKFLFETVNNLQIRIQEFEYKCDALNRTNHSLLLELACKREEFDHFKSTVLTSFDAAESQEEKFRSEIPSFLKVI